MVREVKEIKEKYKAPIISTEKLMKDGTKFLIVLIGILLVAITLVAIYAFDLGDQGIIILLISVVVFYIIVISFLLDPTILREIREKEIERIHSQSVNEVSLGSSTQMIKEVEKPIIQVKRILHEVPRHEVHEIDKPIYLGKKKSLNIPKYDYLGSSETMTYHKHGCRFSKLIKRKYKISKNNPDFFKKRGYKKCEVCMGNAKNLK